MEYGVPVLQNMVGGRSVGQIFCLQRRCSLKTFIFTLYPVYPTGLHRRSATVKRVSALPERKLP